MRLYRALSIPCTATDRLVCDSYQDILRKTASSEDMCVMDESYLILADEKKRYLYDLFGDSIVDALQDSRTSLRLLGALSPANIILLVAAYSMAVISLVLLPLLIVARPYYKLPCKIVGAPMVLALLLLSIVASNTHINWAKRRMCEDKTALCMKLSIACLMAAAELFFILFHFDSDMGVFRCLLLVPFFVCEAPNLRIERGKEPRKALSAIVLSLLRLLLALFVFMWPSTALVCVAILLNIIMYGYCSNASPAMVAAMAVVPTLYAYGILLLIYEQRCTVSLVNSVLLMAVAVFDTKVLELVLKRSQGSLRWLLNA